MKYSTNGSWPLALAAAALLAACQTESNGVPTTSTPPTVEKAPAPQSPAPKTATAEVPPGPQTGVQPAAIEGSPAPQGANAKPTAQTAEKGQAQAQPAAAPKKPAARAAASTLAYPTGDPDTSAILIERFMPPEATAGLPTEYETVVTNLAPIALDNVIVSETIDGNFSISTTEPKITSTAGGVNSWNLGTLAPNQAVTIRVKGIAKNVPSIKTCSSVTYTSGVCAAFPVTLPALQLAATGTLEGLVCDELLYKYTVTNTGTGVARDVVVDVKLPEGVTDKEGKMAVKRTIESLAPGQSQELMLAAKATKTGVYAHTATASALGDLRATANEVKTTLRQPKLKIEGKATDRTYGRDVTAEFTVTNIGDAVAREVTVEATMPAGAKLKTTTENGVERAGLVRWTLANVKPNEPRKVSATVTTAGLGRAGTTVTAKTYCADPVQAVFASDVQGIPAILLEVVDIEDPVAVGAEVSYEITITNQGTAPATNVKLEVVLPSEATFVNATGATATTAQPGADKLAFLPVASIATREKVTWHIHVRGTKAGDGRLKVSMTSNELKSPVEETEATFFYEPQ